MTDLRYPVDLGGRGFVVSREGGRFGRQSIPLQKAQQDTSDLPGEQSLNPEDLWRRSFESWHRGAGQSSFDRSGSDPFRFDGSLGVDPWSKWQLGLLNETEAKLASTASTVKLAVAGSYLYCADGQTLKYTTSITGAGAASWTTVTGTPAADITGLASDGYRVWAAYGSSGLYMTVRGLATAGYYTYGEDVDIVGYAKGRLMIASGQSLHNLTAPGQMQHDEIRDGLSFGDSTVNYKGASTNSSDTAANTKTISVPSGAVEGDLLLLAVSQVSGQLSQTAGGSAWDHVAGFEDFSSAVSGSFIGWRRMEAADSTFTVNFTASVRSTIALVAYSGVNIDSGPTQDVYASSAATTSHVFGSVTAVTGDLVLNVGMTQNSNSFTVPSDPEERVDITNATSASSLVIADYFPAEAGTGYDYTFTSANSASADLYTIVFPAATRTVLFTHPNVDFTWVGFAEGQGDIYAAGYSGDKSLIYRTQVRADGTALDAPVVAGSLPDGEIVRGIYGYLGILFIGTDNGVRMAISDANGDLTIGALIETASPVRCFEGQGRFVWFGLEDYDISRWGSGTYDGLGRLDLTQQTDQLVPAWASDLMATGSTSATESVQSVVTFQDRRLFSIGSSNSLTRGVYGEKANKVATGYLDSGAITYGIADTKVATYLDLRHKALVGDLQVYVSTDEGTFTSIGTSTVASSTRPSTDPMPVGPTRGDVHEVRLRLNRSGSSDAVGPTITRVTLRAEPAPARGRIWQWPLMLSDKVTVNGYEVGRDPAADLLYIEGLFDTQTLITCREDNRTFAAFLKDYEFVAEHRTANGKAEHGICTVTLKEPAS